METEADNDLRAISLTQPWGWSILYAGKRIENRFRSDGRVPDICRQLGPFLLHASKGMTRKAYNTACSFMEEHGYACRTPGEANIEALRDGLHTQAPMIPERRDLVRGAIIGRARGIGHIAPGSRLCLQKRGFPMITLGDVHRKCEAAAMARVERWSDRVIWYPLDVDSQDIEHARHVDLKWWMGGDALLLKDVTPTPAIPCRGHLGRWRVPPDIIAQLQWEEA